MNNCKCCTACDKPVVGYTVDGLCEDCYAARQSKIFTKEQLLNIIAAADEVLTALAGTNGDLHRDDSAKMCAAWDNLNDKAAPPDVVKRLAETALVSLVGQQPEPPQDLIMQINRLMSALQAAKPQSSIIVSVSNYMRQKGYWKVAHCLRTDPASGKDKTARKFVEGDRVIFTGWDECTPEDTTQQQYESLVKRGSDEG